ncbi:uncharacterized, partial [Tachysurus ichikawai]
GSIVGVACGEGGVISKPGSAAAQLHALIAMLSEELLLMLRLWVSRFPPEKCNDCV